MATSHWIGKWIPSIWRRRCRELHSNSRSRTTFHSRCSDKRRIFVCFFFSVVVFISWARRKMQIQKYWFRFASPSWPFFVVFVESNKYAVLVFYHHIAQSLPTDAPTNTKRNQCQNIEIVLSQVACFASYFVVFILFIDCDCVRFRLHFI